MQVVALALEAATAERLSRLRAALTPAGHADLPAHLTLLHAVPSAAAAQLRRQAAELVDRWLPAELRLGPAQPLGRQGVAVFVASPVVGRLRAALQRALWEHLRPQDQAGAPRPHVTLARRLPPAAVGPALLEAAAAWSPTRAMAVGVDLWDYLGGPWRHAGRLVPAAGGGGSGGGRAE